MIERGDSDSYHCTMEDQFLRVLAACRLIVQVLLLYLYHTKAMSLLLVSHMFSQVPGSQSRVHICLPRVRLNHLITMASLFSIFSKFGSLGSNGHFKVCFFSTIFRYFHAAMRF